MKQPPYTTKLSFVSQKALLEALNEIAMKTAGDTVVWATINRKSRKVRFWYAPAGCKKEERTEKDFIEQFEGFTRMESFVPDLLKFIAQGYIG